MVFFTHAVHVERVSIIVISGGEDDPDGLAGRKDESILCNIEVRGLGSTCKNLLEGRRLGREVRDAIDIPLSLPGSLDYTRSSVFSKT